MSNYSKYNKKNSNYYYKNHNNYYYKHKKDNRRNVIVNEIKKDQSDIENTAKINRELIDTFCQEHPFDFENRNISNLNSELNDVGKMSFKEEYALEEPILIKKEKKEEKDKTSKFNFDLRPRFIYFLGPLLLIIILLGTTYAFFNYYKEDSRQADIQAGEVYVTLKENSVPTLTLSKAYPRTNEEARARTDNYVDFTILGKNTSETKEISYTINVIAEGTDANKILIDTQYLKFDLSTLDVSNNETLLLSGVSYSELNSASLRALKVPINTTTEIEQKYRLRMWISDAVVISDTDVNRTYTQAEFNKLYANISVSVNGTARTPIPTASETIEKLAATASYIQSYDDIIASNPTFTTQDTIGSNPDKQTVYYYTGDNAAANANVLFAGYCWQIVRTTDNGGVRMIYNGVAVNNKCETTRSETTWKGINGTNGASTSLSGASLFGRSYDYNLETGEFTLQDSTGLPTAWNNTNYKELIGTYTCKSSLSTCTTLYYVGSYASSTKAYTTSYTIGDVAHYSQIGTSPFNANYKSPALVGYMFNEEYDYKSGSKQGEYFTTAVWENGAYTLSNGNSETAPDATHHYICDTNCSKVRYYYFVSGSSYYYILLENGATIEDAIYKMTGSGSAATKAKTINANYELNNYNSAIKGYLDNWYAKNLVAYTSFLDETIVYCNDRSIKDLAGWNPSGTSITSSLLFKQSSRDRDLNCANEVDRYAVTNSKAKLSYPIGLLTEPERILMTSNFAKTGQSYWVASPSGFGRDNASVRAVSSDGGYTGSYVNPSDGARGVVSLSPGTMFENGSGTYYDPYVVGPLVTRTG